LIIFDAALRTPSVGAYVADICSIISARFQISGYFVEFTNHHCNGQLYSFVSALKHSICHQLNCSLLLLVFLLFI
jgi:hypothetical protein